MASTGRISMMRNLYRKFRRNVADYGPAKGLTKSVRYSVRWAYQVASYRIYGLDVQRIAVPRIETQFAIRLLRSSDAQWIAQVEEMAEWLQGELDRRIEAGSICVAATTDKQVVAFNLVSQGTVTIPPVNLRWSFPDGQAWSEHIATHPGFRKLGLATMLRYRVIQELQDRGVAWFFGGTLKDHPGTLKLASKLGFVELGDLCYARILSRRTWEMRRVVNEDTRRIASPFDGISDFSSDELSI